MKDEVGRLGFVLVRIEAGSYVLKTKISRIKDSAVGIGAMGSSFSFRKGSLVICSESPIFVLKPLF